MIQMFVNIKSQGGGANMDRGAIMDLGNFAVISNFKARLHA